MTEPIKFPAQVARVQTLADGGLRVTLDLPENTIVQAAALMECKRLGITGNVTWEPRQSKNARNYTK
jgi:hypothetical protein